MIPNDDLLIDTEQIYQNAPSGYLSMLPGGGIIKINKTLLGWLGYAEEAVVGRMNFTDLLTKGGVIHYEMFFRPMVSVNGNIRELNYELKGADGKSFPGLINANGVKDATGKLLAVNVVVTDITQRNQYEKELLRARKKLELEKERFRLLADLCQDMVWTVDPEGNINYLNTQMSNYLHIRPHDHSVATLLKLIHPQDRLKLMRLWVMRDGLQDTVSGRVRVHRGNDGWEWFAIRLVPVEEDVDDIKWFGTGTNINEHVKEMERKDEFIHIASHELNTPVTVLKGYLQLMQLDLPQESIKDFISKSLASVNNLQFLIGSLLNVNVINSGELKLNFSAFSLNQLLQFYIEQLNRIAQTHTIILKSAIEDVTVTADRERIAQVVVNLLSNAIKYSPAGKEVQLTVTLSEDQTHAIVSVRDDGVGIPADQLDKIFEKYYRLKETQSIKGLGLGLYITQNILLAHGSRLTVQSSTGKGSTFSFALQRT